MSKEQAISSINEFLLPLRLAGVECDVCDYGSIASVTISGYRCTVALSDNFDRSFAHMCYVFSFGVICTDAELIMSYSSAYLKNSSDTIAKLLENQDDSTTA